MNNVDFTGNDSVGYNILNGVAIQNIPFVVKAPAPPRKQGDMNNDNKINVLDLIFVRNRMGS